MNRLTSLLFVVLFTLNGCGENYINRPTVLIDVEEYTRHGVEAYNNAEWIKAAHFFKKALILYQGIDDQEGVLLSSINLVEVSLARHDVVESAQYLALASGIAKKNEFQHYHSRIGLLNALLAIQQQQLASAKVFLSPLLPVFDNDVMALIADNIQLAAIASQVKIAFLQKQDEVLWTRRYANALLVSGNESVDREAQLLRFQATLLLQQNFSAKAESNLLRALDLYKSRLSRVGIAVTLFELAQYYQSMQNWQKAKDYFNRSQAVYSFLEDKTKLKQIFEMLEQVEN